MEDSLGESKKEVDGVVERPDLNNKGAFDAWLDKYIQKPLGGLDDMSSVPSREEQIRITKNQLRAWAQDSSGLGKSYKQAQDDLVSMAEFLGDDGKEGEKS